MAWLKTGGKDTQEAAGVFCTGSSSSDSGGWKGSQTSTESVQGWS